MDASAALVRSEAAEGASKQVCAHQGQATFPESDSSSTAGLREMQLTLESKGDVSAAARAEARMATYATHASEQLWSGGSCPGCRGIFE